MDMELSESRIVEWGEVRAFCHLRRERALPLMAPAADRADV